MVIAIAVAGAMLVALAAELWHTRRVARLGVLAFGPRGRPAGWVRAVPLLRSVAVGLLVGGLVALLTIEPKVHHADAVSADEFRHLVLVLDVSPSMRLRDAGPTRKQSRSERARDVLDSLFGRVSIGNYKITVVATYSGALPVVIDTTDAEVVRNVLGDLPMQYAFQPGKTQLFAGIEEAARIAKPWDPSSALLVVMSDGDTVPPTGMPVLPPAFSGVLVVGVGDPLAGSFIDGRQSRQDASSLRQIAVRLGGVYQDGNARQVSSDAIRTVTGTAERSALERLGEREYAMLAALLGALGLAFLPLLLVFAGTRWRPGVPPSRVIPAGRSGREHLSDRRTSDRVSGARRGPGDARVSAAQPDNSHGAS